MYYTELSSTRVLIWILALFPAESEMTIPSCSHDQTRSALGQFATAMLAKQDANVERQPCSIQKSLPDTEILLFSPDSNPFFYGQYLASYIVLFDQRDYLSSSTLNHKQ